MEDPHVPSREWNRQKWGQQHDWKKAGDEWSGMAAFCGQPYDAWKSSLVDTFIAPRAGGARVLEIAPGHGRWSAYLVELAKSVALVDLNQSCLDACRERFTGADHVSYHLTDGYSLPFLPSESVDFVWSFDSFVHMSPDIVRGYLGEFARVLVPGGTGVIHHAGKSHVALQANAAARRLGKPGTAVSRLIGRRWLNVGGARSGVSAKMVRRWTEAAGLRVTDQVDSWGPSGEFTVRKHHDAITVFAKPAA
jgi:ubiquinone/menaquinone biosynthesis C-methylase UbiE